MAKWNVEYPEWGDLAEPDPDDLAKPVKWLSASELWRAAVRHLLSTKIGEYVDRREFAGRVLLSTGDLDGIATDDNDDTDDHQPTSGEGADTATDPVWLDFVADVGDGYKASFAVAQSLDSDHLYRTDGADPADHPTDQGPGWLRGAAT